MDQARAETDLETRKGLYADIQQKLDTLVPEGTIDVRDLDHLTLTDDVEEAVDIIRRSAGTNGGAAP